MEGPEVPTFTGQNGHTDPLLWGPRSPSPGRVPQPVTCHRCDCLDRSPGKQGREAPGPGGLNPHLGSTQSWPEPPPSLPTASPWNGPSAIPRPRPAEPTIPSWAGSIQMQPRILVQGADPSAAASRVESPIGAPTPACLQARPRGPRPGEGAPRPPLPVPPLAHAPRPERPPEPHG